MTNKSFKKIILIILAAFGSLSFSMTYAENMQQMQTKYFDIIYDKEIEVAARILYEKADAYAEEIAKKLHKESIDRVPVYLVSQSQYLNGYFTRSAHNHLVILVTPPANGELENLENSLLKVFYHEYTHLLTLGFDYIGLIPNNIIFPDSLKEGVAVAFESSYDQKYGRLRDPLIWHTLVQNKLDDKTPYFTQTGWYRDMYPKGKWVYLYGGAFSQYLIKTYGEAKFAQLWDSDWRLFVKHKFYNVYNVPLDDVWNDFIAQIPVPTNVKQGEFLDNSLTKSGYKNLFVAQSDIYFFDTNDNWVYKYTKDKKTQALFFAGASLDSISVADDNQSLLVTDLIYAKNSTLMKTGRYRTRVFSLAENRFLNEEYFDIREASFVEQDSIIATKIDKAATTSIVLIDRKTAKTQSLYKASLTTKYTSLHNPAYMGDKKIAFIAAKGLDRDILVMNLATKKISKLQLDAKIKAIRYLQATKTDAGRFLTFAWADAKMLYRTAKLDIKNSQLILQTADISGGGFYPVVYGDKILTVAKHATYNNLQFIPNQYLEKLDYTLVDAEQTNPEVYKFSQAMPKTTNYNAFASSWLWGSPGIGLVVAIPTRILEIGAFGIGINISMTDPTEFVYGNLETIIYGHPIFLQLKANLGIKDKGFDFHIKGHESLTGYASARVRKTGVGLNLAYTPNLLSANQFLKFDYDLVSDWAHIVYDYKHTKFKPKLIFWQNSASSILSAYKKKYTDTLLTHSIGLKFLDVRTSSIIRSNFFAKDISRIGFSARVGHTHHIQSQQDAFFGLLRLEGRTPTVPLTLGLTGFAGNKAYLQASSGSVYYFNQDWLVDDNTGGYTKGIFAYSGRKDKEIQTSQFTSAVGFDANIVFFDYEIQDTASFIPLMFNRFKMDIEYNGILQMYKTDKFKTDYQDSINVGFLLDFSGIELAVRLGTPLSVKPDFVPGVELKASW